MQNSDNNKIIRPPVIVIMGHIDHGKSTLLDYIRKSNVVAKEAGGITQHISAYEVTHKDGEGKDRKITFLDTPGHEAFQAMRSRGAKVADIAILVVSAEDGVKPQTLEALKAITTAKLPYIVAITKIDKPSANVDRIKQNLTENEIYIEGYGGTIPAVPISAKTGEGVSALLDMMLLVADLENISGDATIPAEGIVIESHLDQKKGVAGTLIIKNGTLRKGMYVVAGDSVAPVRIMENFLGKTIDEATFSSPIQIIGWSKAPIVGSTFTSCATKKEAEAAAEEFTLESKSGIKPQEKTSVENAIVIPIIIKADKFGVGEAILGEIKKLEKDTVSFKVMAVASGEINEGDVKLVLGTTGGIIVGFNVKTDPRAIEMAERQGVAIKTFDIIYKLAEWLAEVVTERTPKVTVEELRGRIKILKTFSKTKDKQVIGGKVEEGEVGVRDHIKILRRGEVIGEGEIVGLQQKKEKTSSVTVGSECGILVNSKMEIVAGDELHSFILVTK